MFKCASWVLCLVANINQVTVDTFVCAFLLCANGMALFDVAPTIRLDIDPLPTFLTWLCIHDLRVWNMGGR